MALLLALALPPAARAQWDVQGLPLLSYSTDEGFGYGGRLVLIERGAGVQPYRYSIGISVWRTTKDIGAYSLSFDAPSILGTKNRIEIEAGLGNYQFFPYYGVGNGSAYEPRFDTCADRDALAKNPDVCAGNPDFRGLRYYRYGQFTLPGLKLNLRRDLSGPWKLFAGYRFRNVRITPLYPIEDLGQTGSSRLIEDARAGLLSGWDGSDPGRSFRRRAAELTAGLVFDTRDNEPAPTEGMFHEASLRGGSRLLGGESTFGGANATFRFYRWLFHRSLVAAGRLLLDGMTDGAPFFLLNTTGGLGGPDGLGGESSVRGLMGNRVQGQAKLIGNLELRWTFLSVGRFDFRAVAALDGGRVWRELGKGDAGPLRFGGAGGLRVAWNRDFVIRFDYGIGISEPYGDGNIYLTFGEAF